MMKITYQSTKEEIQEELVRRAREYRLSAQMTQEELADKAVVSVGTVCRFERGEDIGFSKVISILCALGIGKNLEEMIPDPADRPTYHLANSNTKKKRVRHQKDEPNRTEWKWGDEQ